MSKEKSDLTLKILALLLAVFMWSYVMNDENPVIKKEYRNINLEFINKESLDRDGLVVMNTKKEKIYVKLSGKKREIDDFSPSAINAYVDLNGFEEGQEKVPVKISLDHQTDSIKIIEYEPREVDITFDKIITKNKKIAIRPTGDLKAGYVLGDIFTKSETVLLKGPRSWVDEINEVVAFVDLEGRTRDGKINTPLRLLDKHGNDVGGVEKEPNTIDITVPILRSKKVDIELITDNQLPEDYEMKQLVINPTSVVIKGDESILGMTKVETKELKLEDLINKKEVKAELNLPEGVELLDSTLEIKVALEMVDLNEKEMIKKLGDIEILNLNPKYSLELDLEREIGFTIVGDRERLESISPKNIRMFMDMKDLESGVHNVRIQGENTEDYNIKNIVPESIQLEVNARVDSGEIQ